MDVLYIYCFHFFTFLITLEMNKRKFTTERLVYTFINKGKFSYAYKFLL
jgi:hypothetical protein